MKVEVDVTTLADAVDWNTKIIDSRPINAILSGIKLVASQGSLLLHTYNFDTSAHQQIEAGVEEEGTILVKGKLLSDITRSLPGEKVILTTNQSSLIITSGKSVFTMPLMKVDDYPELPVLPAKIGQVDGQTFIQIVNQVSIAVARDQNRAVLSSINIHILNNECELNATDRYRIARGSFLWTPTSENTEIQILVSGILLKDIVRSMNKNNSVILYFDNNNPSILGIENDGRILTVKLIDSEYPQTDRFFNRNKDTEIVIDRKKMLDSIRRMMLVAEKSSSIHFTFKNQEVELSAGSVDTAQAHESFSVDIDGDEQTVLYNPQYLVDGLGVIEEPYVRLKIGATNSLISGQQKIDEDESLAFQYVFVPSKPVS